jgi:hypothetical protein
VQGFCDELIDCGFEGLGFTIDPFSWKRGRMKESLEMAVANGPRYLMHP